MGIVCAAYAPLMSDRSSKMTEADARNTANLARHADIVVVDWFLDGRNSSLATNLIQSILDADRNEGGRLRLITVDTGEDGLRHLRDQLLASLQNAGYPVTPDDEGQSPAIRGHHRRLVFLNKVVDGIEAGPHVVSLPELPGRLVHEFATMTRGIMPGVALASISAVRAPKSLEGSSAREFLWLGDLRAAVAQRIAHELASSVGRIGLDEYEWLGRKAP